VEDHIFDSQASQTDQDSEETRDEPKKKRSELDSLVPKALMRKKKKAPKPVVDVDDGEEVVVDETTAVASAPEVPIASVAEEVVIQKGPSASDLAKQKE
jgi:hypothetical protein